MYSSEMASAMRRWCAEFKANPDLAKSFSAELAAIKDRLVYADAAAVGNLQGKAQWIEDFIVRAGIVERPPASAGGSPFPPNGQNMPDFMP